MGHLELRLAAMTGGRSCRGEARRQPREPSEWSCLYVKDLFTALADKDFCSRQRRPSDVLGLHN